MRDFFAEEIGGNPTGERDYFTEELVKNKPDRSENILQKAAKAVTDNMGMNTLGFANPLNLVKAAYGARDVIIDETVENPIMNFITKVGTDPVAYGLQNPIKAIGSGMMKVGSATKQIPSVLGNLGKGISRIPGRVGEIWNAPKTSANIGKQIAGLEGDIAGLEASGGMKTLPRKGEKILNQAQSNIMSEFETKAKDLSSKSRNIFVEHVPKMKEDFSKLTKDTYGKYGEILKKGEEEALAGGMNADLYREEVINPVLDVIEKTGAKTQSAEKLKRLFTAKEGISDAAYQKADEAILGNFEKLDSLEKMKALRTSLFKPGSEDFIQNMYSDLHGKFVGKFSPSVAKANQSYGPMKNALRWGSKTIKPFNEQEITRVADILQKNKAGGKGNETVQAYLNTLQKGKGEFKGSNLTKLSKQHESALKAIDSEIQANQKAIENLNKIHTEDIVTLRKAGTEDVVSGRNILQDVASKKSAKSNLKVLKEKVDRDMRIRDNLIKYGIISGLVAVGAGPGVYSLARAIHQE